MPGNRIPSTQHDIPLSLVPMDQKGRVYTYQLPKKAEAIDCHLKERDMQMWCLVVHLAALG